MTGPGPGHGSCPRHGGSIRMSSLRLLLLLVAISALLPLGGCAATRVRPYERELLADPAMQMGAAPVELSADEHIYFSKEASSGGRGFAAGGCGCN